MSSGAEVPPGVPEEGQLILQHSGGNGEWVPFSKIKLYTNTFIREEGKILLGYKKRGFGVDMYNGFGGKVDAANETVAEAALRELEEEAGIVAPLRSCGRLFFMVEGVMEAFDIEIFVAHEYTGTITESDEMRPKWFSTADNAASEPGLELPAIPYSQMWADDVFWMPMLLEGKSFVGRADFSKEGKMLKWWFAEVRQQE